jgi:hypothetical protein
VQISEQTATFALYIINSLVFITVVESFYSAVWTDFIYSRLRLVFKGSIYTCSISCHGVSELDDGTLIPSRKLGNVFNLCPEWFWDPIGP